MVPIISYNGQIGNAETSVISPFDRGFTLGDGLFETMKAHGNTVWYLERHLARLECGAARLGITIPAQLRVWIKDVVERAGETGEVPYVLRVTLTRGVSLTHGLRGSSEQQPTIVIAALAWPHFPASLYEQGIRVQVGTARRNEQSSTAGLKTTSYLESVLALRDAVSAGYDDVILLNTRAFVAEASASNVFVWRDGTLVTPSLACGILPGITREVVLGLAEQLGFGAIEGEITQTELIRADEIFLTSSLRGIVPVRAIDQQLIGSGAPGENTLALMGRYGGAVLGVQKDTVQSPKVTMETTTMKVPTVHTEERQVVVPKVQRP